MDLLPSEEQIQIASVVADFLRDQMPINAIRQRRSESTAVDASTWARCGELGWFGLGLPEVDGGVGYGLAEEVLLFRELGRQLAPGPFVSSVLGARVAADAGADDIAAAIVAGTVSVGLAEARGHGCSVGATVSGSFDLLDAPGSTYLLVYGPDAVVLVETAAIGTAQSIPCVDPAVRLARVELDAVASRVIVTEGHDQIGRRGSALVAAMLTGIAEATRDMSSEYAKVRVQFGRPIGVNQAIKHACADMALRAEAASAQLLFAALSVDEGRSDAAFQVAAARIVATDAAIENATRTIQVHGGMGYTFEHDAHLFLKRARVLDRVLGDSRSQMAALIDLPAAQ